MQEFEKANFKSSFIVPEDPLGRPERGTFDLDQEADEDGEE